jgi:hypothetical protein
VFENCGIGVWVGDVGAKGTASAERAPELADALRVRERPPPGEAV